MGIVNGALRKKRGISCIMQRKVYDYSAYSYARKKRNNVKKRTRYETMRFIAVALICLLVGVLLYTNLHKSSKITLVAKKYYAVEVGSYASESTALYFAAERAVSFTTEATGCSRRFICPRRMRRASRKRCSTPTSTARCTCSSSKRQK